MLEQGTTVTTRRKRNFFKRYLPLILVVVVIVLASLTVYFYKKSQNSNPNISQTEIKSLVQKVGRLAVIPRDETPTVATVSDPEALKNQSFFAGAKKGDKVLIFANAKKAYLYDPSADKIINIAPLNTGDTAASTSASTVTPATAPTKK